MANNNKVMEQFAKPRKGAKTALKLEVDGFPDFRIKLPEGTGLGRTAVEKAIVNMKELDRSFREVIAESAEGKSTQSVKDKVSGADVIGVLTMIASGPAVE